MLRHFKIYFIAAALLLIFYSLAKAEEILSWNDCLAQAQKNNPDLVSAVAQIDQQKAGKDITASGLYPQLDATAGATTAASKADSGASTTADSYSYGVNGSQLIFDGFKTINDTKAAQEKVKGAKENYRFTSSSVRWSLRTAFVNLLKAQELITVAQEIEKIRRDNLMLITLRYQSGLEHKGALMTAEANAAQARLEISGAKRDVELAQRQLAKAMGQKEFQPLSVRGDFSLAENSTNKPDFDELVKNNPSILQAIAKKNAAAFGVKSAYGNFVPQVSADALAGRRSADWPPENNQWSAGLNISLPLFEGGLQQAQLAQAKALYQQTQADERTAHDAALVALEQTWGNFQNAVESVDVAKKTLDASVERSKIAEAQYSIGTITFDNWTIIENNLVLAKRAYLQAQANALLTEADWIQAKGETLEYVQ